MSLFTAPILARELPPLVRPDLETIKLWNSYQENAPKAYLDPGFKNPRGSYSLLDHMDYIPTEYNQGNCGNCWAWAGVSCMAILLDVREDILDRLSVQHINSCQAQVIGKSCCSGGWIQDVCDFYSAVGYTVPWSNTNAEWQDGDDSCDTDCSTISTSPSYPISDIYMQTIETHNVTQEQAISNIKNVLNQDKPIWFSFTFSTYDDWGPFVDFWNNQSEEDTFNPNYSCGHDWNSGGSHAVVCVGYNDDDPENSYWIMVNSYGTTPNRPNGIFRMDMDMMYHCTHFYDGNPFYNFWFDTMEIDYSDPTPTPTGPTPTPSPTPTGPTPTPPPYTTIYDIQYTTDPSGNSPYVGQQVVTRGVVTACEEDNDYVCIQDGDGPWSGLTVYDPPINLEIGDLVEVSGTIIEYYGLTELSPADKVVVLSNHNPIPEPMVLMTGETSREQWESVLVRNKNVTVTNPDIGYGEWEVNDGSGPQMVNDSYSYSYIPMLNDDLYYVTGPLSYSYGNFKIEPRGDFDIVISGEPTPTPTPTYEPTATATGAQTPTFSPAPTNTPAPSFTPTPSATFTLTPTPACESFEPYLWLNQSVFESGDDFILKSYWCNPGETRTVDYYIILDIQDALWFWPSWSTDVDKTRLISSSGSSDEIELFNFKWPEVDSSNNGLKVWAGFIDPGSFELVGNVHWVEFGYR